MTSGRPSRSSASNFPISNIQSQISLIPTIDYIQACFDEYNVRYFNGSLPPIPIKLSNARTFLGKVTFIKHRTWLFGEWRYSNFKLRINTRFDLPVSYRLTKLLQLKELSRNPAPAKVDAAR